MNTNDFEFKIKTAQFDDIFNHLSKCDSLFIPPLDQRLNINEYALKLYEKSITFETWEKTILIGLVACYLNDCKNKVGYITSVSVMQEYLQLGIANQLLNLCINYARNSNFSEIKLEVNKNNTAAINLYKKFNFTILEEIKNNYLLILTLNK